MSGSGHSSWLHRLRERGVIRVAASYAVIAWLLLQIADVIFEPLGVPRWAMVSLIVAAGLGFPAAIALAWFYEAGERGIERDTATAGVVRPMTHGLRRYADVLIIGVLLAAVAVLLVRQSELGGKAAGNPAIAVLPFQNLGTAPEGDVLALGIAESVLYQLANLAELDVISRTSSFSFAERREDAQEIGRQLGVGYLLEGSVQSDRLAMRVTTRLIDAGTGAEVWAMRFDRPRGDIFAVQDEIAVQVTQALELSIDPVAMERMTGQGTTSLGTYLAFLQGRALLANHRLADVKEATGHFERSLKLDPDFAAAYVSLAEAVVFVAEYEIRPDRQSRFESALRRGQELVAKALALDPDNGEAYLQRAHLSAFGDLSSAEADYRRGLDLSPNAAKGYAGLAAVVYEDPSRRDEVLVMLDRARKLDPLEPRYDVTKALFLQMERADFAGADALLVDAVKRNPRYQPALARLAELRYLVGQPANSIRYGERALALDPALEIVRRNLISAYVDLGDLSAARQLIEDEGVEPSPRQLKVLLREGAWRQAGELAYDSLAQGALLSDIETAMNVAAIRMHARATGEFERARAALEDASGVRWDAAGRAILPQGRSPLRDAAIGLADLLLKSGQEPLGRELLATILARMRYEIGELGRPEYWYYRWHPTALALNGEHGAAIAMIERSVASGLGLGDWWYYLESEPAYAPLRRDARFQELLRQVRAHVEVQRRVLNRLRADGVVPERGVATRSP
jgi:TolB-like protein/Tfp pilus assembly protein PilF